MSKYVKVASVLFSTRTERDAADSKKIIVSETAETLNAPEGCRLGIRKNCPAYILLNP
jgi:hypothetical protein